MKQSDVIVKREQVHLRFKNEEMDFMFNWVLGMGKIVGLSHGEISYAIAGIKEGDPVGWPEGFRREGHYLHQRALDFEQEHRAAAGHSFLAAAIYGISGGGYFSAQAVVADPRLQAWIASTPIVDMAQVFEREMGGAMKTPGWFLNTVMRLQGAVNAAAALNLKKYAWQLGTSDFKQAYEGVLQQAIPVDYERITCPTLLLMGESEGAELKRQTQVVYEALRARGQDVTLREFVKEDGADAHCQVNNLHLAHQVVFDWLDRVFSQKKDESSLSRSGPTFQASVDRS